MAKRTGRPSKGPRDAIGTRISPAHSAKVRDIGAQHGWYHSETAAALIEVGLRHIDDLAPPARGRDWLLIRVPAASGAALRGLAADLGWSFSDTAAALIAVGFGHLNELPTRAAAGTTNDQQELPLTKAS